MSEDWRAARVADVQAGDVVRTPSGQVVTVTRIEPAFMGITEMVAFIEHTPSRWFKCPQPVSADIEIRITGG